MEYHIKIRRSVLKTLEVISEPHYSAVKTAIYDLGKNPRPYGYKKLKGRPGYRIRVGDYRILYDIFDNVLIIDIINVGHRKDVY